MELDKFKGRKGVIYTRRSTDTREQREHSNREQFQLCQQMCDELGIVLPYEHYSDRGTSGLGERPNFSRLKVVIETGKINPDFIICEKLDREGS